ncbi:MAG: hypothetical protein QOF16_1623 [Actinomycetota bacterium]|nr:hypothetical protein [Actinomycetota bacterium]
MARNKAARRGVGALIAAVMLSTFTLGALMFGQSASAAAPKTQPSPTGSVAPSPINTPAPMPANKTAAIGNTVDDVTPEGDHVVLEEQMKVSSPQDLILNLSSECAVITQLVTGSTKGTATDTAEASGKVEMWVTIDGENVPVAGPPGGGGGDDGTIVFCSQARGRQVTDNENPGGDGQDKIADYMSARQANAFQWLALNVGTAYDNPANGQNILDIQVHAKYTDQRDTDCDALSSQAPSTTFAQTCSKAYIGRRTLIVEPTHASVIETTDSGAGGS